MSNAVSRETVEAFYRAFVSRDPEQLGPLLDDDVEWHVGGPVEAIQICGSWRGKEAVIDRLKNLVPKIIKFKGLDIEALLVDGDSSAVFCRLSSIHRASGRLISHRAAHLVRYRDGKVVSFRAVTDSLDAAEQFLGHRIDVFADADGDADDLIAV